MKRFFWCVLTVGTIAVIPESAVAQCTDCAGRFYCARVDHSWAAECIYDNEGCVPWGMCIIIIRRMEEELLVAAEDVLRVDTEWGEVPMAIVEDDLAVAWRCNGDVLWAARTSGSELEWIDPKSMGRDLSFQAVRRRMIASE